MEIDLKLKMQTNLRRNTMTKTSGEISHEIQILIYEYEKTVKEELETSNKSHLMNLVRSSNSKWSGGFSITNTLEKIVQEIAIEKLDNILEK